MVDRADTSMAVSREVSTLIGRISVEMSNELGMKVSKFDVVRNLVTAEARRRGLVNQQQPKKKVGGKRP